jgi:hypothetical protein
VFVRSSTRAGFGRRFDRAQDVVFMRLELRVPIDDVLPTLVAQHDHSSVRISDARGQGDRAEIVGSRPVIPAKWPDPWSGADYVAGGRGNDSLGGEAEGAGHAGQSRLDRRLP